MIYRKYIVLPFLLLACLASWGQDFNPTSPAEPAAKYQLSVLADPAEAGTVSGGGMYEANKSVTVKATVSSAAWTFEAWTDAKGDTVSKASSYTLKKAAATETLTAHFAPARISTITLSYDPQSAGQTFSLSGSGTYGVGKTVTITASNYTNWTFVNWTRQSDGEVMSTARSFTYTTRDADEHFIAHYQFNPSGNPSEPSETRASHKIYFKSNPSNVGSFSTSSGVSVKEGYTYSITAYTSTNYQFVNWTDAEGNEVSTSRTLTGTMGTEDLHFVANHIFVPGSPADPGASTKSHFTLYGPTVELYKGIETLFPVYLENTSPVKQLSFSLLLPEGVSVNAEAVKTTNRTSAYGVATSMEGQKLSVSLSGGTQIGDVNGIILQLPVTVAESVEDGSYPLVFSDMEMTLTDGTTINATSRQGTLAVSTIPEGEIQARFTVDRYMNRARFTNMSSEDCRTFAWDFGDGTTSTEASPFHVYEQPGTYTVALTAKGIVKQSVAEQIIIINAPSTWTADGDYTLNADTIGVRNFLSFEEAIDLLSQCTPTSAITISIAGTAHSYDATDSLKLSRLTTLTGKLVGAKKEMTLKAEEECTVSITMAEEADRTGIVSFVRNTVLDNVRIMINGNEATMNADDYAALVKIYEATGGSAWTTKKWNIARPSLTTSSWSGVTISDEGRVTAIDLSSNNLTGELPSSGITLPMLTTLNLSNNSLQGDVKAFASLCPALTTLNMSKCMLESLSGALPSTITSLDLSYQNNALALADLPQQEWTLGSVVNEVNVGTLVGYDHQARNFTLRPQLALYSATTTTTGVTAGAHIGTLTYSAEGYKLTLNGDYKLPLGTAVYTSPQTGVAKGTRIKAAFNWLTGDANIDGVVDIFDAQHTLNRVLGRDKGMFNFCAANTYDSDKIINVQDIVSTINIFIAEETEDEATSARSRTPMNAAELTAGSVEISDGALWINTTVPVAALDIQLNGVGESQVSLQLNHSKYQMFTYGNDRGVRVVVMSLTGDELAEGITKVLRISSRDASVSAVKTSDSDAKAVLLGISQGSGTDGITTVTTSSDASDAIYDLHGRRLSTTPAKGVYIYKGKKVK